MAVLLDSRSIVVAPAGSADDTFAPRLGVESVMRLSSSTISASAEATGGEAENAVSEGSTHDFWRPGTSGVNWLRASLDQARAANYMAVAAHNLHQVGGSVKCQYSDDGGSSWQDASGDLAQASSSPIMILFDDVTADDFRLWVSATGTTLAIGVVYIGEIIALNSPITGPWTPPYLRRANRYVNDVAEGGQFMGRSVISEGAELDLQQRGVSLDWIRETWEPAVRKMEVYPFFFAARDISSLPLSSGTSEPEVFFGWATEQPASYYENNVWGGLSLRAQGIVS